MLKKLLPHGLAVFLILTVVLAGCDGGRNDSLTPQSWQVVGNPGFSADQVYNTAIAIDGNGVPYVVYYEPASGSSRITVMRFEGGNWESVGSTGLGVFLEEVFISIVIDGNDVLYLAYKHPHTDFTVRKYDGEWTTVGGYALGDPYPYIEGSIAIGKYGVPYVVYHDGFQVAGAVTVKKYAGAEWITVGSAGFAKCAYPSIAIDGTGVPYVAYSDRKKA